MARDFVKEIEREFLKQQLPSLAPGDSVRVKIRIKEGNKERLQAYEGVIIKIRGSNLNKTITVRRVFQGVGVERVFLLHSPKVDSIQVIRKGDVRRAKLYYLRQRTGKAARIREKIGAATDKMEQIYEAEVAPPEVVEEVAAPVAEAPAEAPAVEAAAPEAAVEAPPAEVAAPPAEEAPAPAEAPAEDNA